MPTLDYINELPDVYRKDEDSNNWKLLSLEGSLVFDFQACVDEVLASLNVHSAKGKTLDLYGEMLGQYRNGADDEQYRYMILSSASKNFCGGNYNSTIEQLAIVFNCDSSEFSFTENTDKCTVSLEALPMEVVLRAGVTQDQLVEIIESLLPTGVKLEGFELSGSFTFGSSEDEYDENAGFGNEEQTIGGYFGVIALKT